MWLEKLSEGVLRVLTPLGPRFVRPSFVQRLYLLWIFRNFHTLPTRVLSRGQQRLIDRMCVQRGFISQFGPSRVEEFAVLGTLEQPLPIEQALPPRRPPTSIHDAVRPLVADAQRQS
jgi:hypothetical protein